MPTKISHSNSAAAEKLSGDPFRVDASNFESLKIPRQEAERNDNRAGERAHDRISEMFKGARATDLFALMRHAKEQENFERSQGIFAALFITPALPLRADTLHVVNSRNTNSSRVTGVTGGNFSGAGNGSERGQQRGGNREKRDQKTPAEDAAANSLIKKFSEYLSDGEQRVIRSALRQLEQTLQTQGIPARDSATAEGARRIVSLWNGCLTTALRGELNVSG